MIFFNKHYPKLLFLCLITILVACKQRFPGLSEQDNKYRLTTEKQLKDKAYCKKIEDFYTTGKAGYFTGKAGIQIYYKIFEQKHKDKVVLIAAGRTEAAIKYKELIFDLFKNGYSVYIHDHRGQGLSGRMIDDPMMGYVDSFQYYIDDMKYFFDNYLKPKKYKKKYLLAHSMGGAIGMTYLEQNPSDFDAAAFSSPMLGFKPLVCSIVKVLDAEKPKYAIGEKTYNDDKNTFKKNTLTGSELRYDRMITAFEKEPQAKLGGATYHWVDKSCEQFDIIFNNIEKIKTPFILFSAKNEQIVNPKAHQKFIEIAHKKGKISIAYQVKNAQHELLIEKDKQRIETITKILEFYNQY